MWIYDDHSEDEYKNVMKCVEQIAVNLGAEYVCTKKEKFITFTGDTEIIEETELNIYRYNDEYFEVESHYQSDRPFIVLSFGDTPETIFDDADPFPYNLSYEELISEVKYSLGIEPYPADWVKIK